VKPATWHWFALKGEEPRPLFAFPGTWLEGSPQEAFALVKPFDPERMHIVQEGMEKKDLLAA